MLLGAHVPSADPIAAATTRGAEVVQVFLSAPRSWRPPEPRGDVDRLRGSGLPLYAHTPYLVNLASGDPAVRARSAASVQATCAAAAAIGARGVVVHGGHVPVGEDPALGWASWRAMLERLETDVPVLIENTAGGKNAMARRVEQLARLWDAIDGVDAPVGCCLDTCHLHAGGEDDLLVALDRIRAIVGTIDLLHVNDSRDPAGSGRDRHANLGTGQIDPAVLVEVARRAGAPVIVETPGSAADQAADLAWLRTRLDAAPTARAAAVGLEAAATAGAAAVGVEAARASTARPGDPAGSAA
jgi:deoxyribonuclease IV